jgi:hypothetical protein
LFCVAKHHIDIPLPFGLDVVKYKKHLEENIDGELRKGFLKEGLDNDD